MLATQSLNPHPYPPVPYSSASTVAAYASSGPLAAMSMYNSMQQQHHHHHHHPQQSPYAFAAQPAQQQAPPPPRQYGTQGTSSAFSASANPDEDWTKISDLAERRRIQNRIAQRNYRKKLKRRLEDLERRAGSPDSTESQKPSPASKPAKRAPVASKATKIQKQQPKQRQASTSPALSPPSAPVAPSKHQAPPHMQFTPPTETVDEFIMPSQYDDARDPSHSPPPMYAAASSAYSSYPPPDEQLLLTPYSTAQAYPTMVTADGGYTTYLPTASAAPPSTTIPPMTHFTDAFKRDSYASDSGISSYSTGYSFYPGMDVNGSSPYESNPHTPPLSHTFDHSANCSESGYDYPTTPLSMPGSPAMVQQL